MDIKKEQSSLEERGVPQDSHFMLTFTDGSVHSEHDTNWSDISTQTTVDFFGKQKIAFLCNHPVSKIKICHGTLETEIDVPEGCQVYQSIRASVLFTPGKDIEYATTGRVVGLVKDCVVIEEQFLDAIAGKVIGIR